MIQGYPRVPSVVAGGRLRLHVSTTAPRYRVEFYRQGERLVHLGTSDWRRGQWALAGQPDRDWVWPTEEFDVPANWPAGVFLAHLVEGDDDTVTAGAEAGPQPPTFDARDARVLFLVRNRPPGSTSRVLYKLAWFTYHAYNASGGGSLYQTGSWLPSAAPISVTTRRPGGGTGGALSFPEAQDVYDPATPREGFSHWDAPMIAWLERNGHAVEFCTDLDLHEDPGLLDAYNLLLCVGHDEYWSATMRGAVQRFVGAGGNVAFFAGNVCWWRVDVAADGGSITCRHPVVAQADSDQWWRHEPENSLTGVSYRNGGGWWTGPRDAVGYTVQHAGHWVYDGSGLSTGDTFGAEQRLVGYECDGARLTRTPAGHIVAAGTDGSPPDLAVLGVAPLGVGWQDRPAGANAAATMVVLNSGPGTVFTAGTTDWSRVLDAGHVEVERITTNVLTRLAVRGLRITGPHPCESGSTFPAVGERARFRAELPYTAGNSTVRAIWTVTVGDGPGVRLESEGPEIEVALPPEASLLTVAVTAYVGGPAGERFGTLTVRVLSAHEGAQAKLLCSLRDLVLAAVPPLLPTSPVQVGNRPFGDPEWEPVRDGLRRLLDHGDARAALARAEAVVASARRLAGATGG
ncbi:MAG: hypothetical protein HYX52_04050 [Chloroflexi bacterium]|nr:hypothetical protein [Chloroflexota bacterium]